MNHEEKVQELRTKLMDLRDEIKAHAQEVDEPQCAALCETTSEVLTGLETAFGHYLDKSEAAWQ